MFEFFRRISEAVKLQHPWQEQVAKRNFIGDHIRSMTSIRRAQTKPGVVGSTGEPSEAS